MSQLPSRLTDPERGDSIQSGTGILAIRIPRLRGFTAFKVDDNDSFEQPPSASNQPLQPEQGESNFGDSSGPIFSMYSKLAGEEDDEMVDRWQKDADGILIFVSPSIDVHTNTHTNQDVLDWSVLCRGSWTTRHLRPGPQAKFSRYLCILSREYIPDSR